MVRSLPGSLKKVYKGEGVRLHYQTILQLVAQGEAKVPNFQDSRRTTKMKLDGRQILFSVLIILLVNCWLSSAFHIGVGKVGKKGKRTEEVKHFEVVYF